MAVLAWILGVVIVYGLLWTISYAVAYHKISEDQTACNKKARASLGQCSYMGRNGLWLPTVQQQYTFCCIDGTN